MSSLRSFKKISVVIACYQDAQAIPIIYERLKAVFSKIGVDYELLFVNDCSPDDSAEVLSIIAHEDKNVVVITHTRNFGSQNAFTSGMKIATGDAVVLMDGDLQDPPEMIEKLFAKWIEGYQVVYGQRVKREATLFLKFAYKAFYRVFRAVSYVPMPLDAGDFSLLDRSVVNALNALPENNRFIRGLRAWVGFKQIGVPYTRPERMFGVTTNSFFKNLAWARKGIVSFSYAPLELITVLGISVVLFAFLGIIAQILLTILRPSATSSGISTVIVLILFLGGIQLLCLSIIGWYLSHIYDEVKHRPPYIVGS